MFDETTFMTMPPADISEMQTQSECKLFPFCPEATHWLAKQEAQLIKQGDSLLLAGDKLHRDYTMLADADGVDSFSGEGALAWDDLLDVNQTDINVELTVPSTIAYTNKAIRSGSLSAETFDDSDDLSTTSWTNTSTSTHQSREESLASLISSVSKLDSSRKKLLHSMERTHETRRALKRRRLSTENNQTCDALLSCLQRTEDTHKKIFDNLHIRYSLSV